MSESHLPFDAVSKIEELERRIWELERRRLPVVPPSAGTGGGGVIVFDAFARTTSIASTNAQTSMLDAPFTMPASVMGQGAVFKCGIMGRVLNNTGAPRTMTVLVSQLAGSAFGWPAFVTLPTSADYYNFVVDATIVGNADVTYGEPNLGGHGTVLMFDYNLVTGLSATRSFPLGGDGYNVDYGPTEVNDWDITVTLSVSSASLTVDQLNSAYAYALT